MTTELEIKCKDAESPINKDITDSINSLLLPSLTTDIIKRADYARTTRDGEEITHSDVYTALCTITRDAQQQNGQYAWNMKELVHARNKYYHENKEYID